MSESDLEKTVKEISKDIDTLIALKKIEIGFVKSKETDKNEERKFQTQLATLQVDVQIWLTLLIGSIAVFVSLLIYSGQMFFTVLTNSPAVLKYSSLVSIGISIVGLVSVTVICSRKMQEKRNEMEKLPSLYVKANG